RVGGAIEKMRREKWWKAISTLVALFAEMGGEIDDDCIEEEKRVHAFYSGQLTDSEGLGVIFAGVLIAITFGAIHCVGWSFSFPSHTEQILWRISSISITSAPVVLLFLGMVNTFDLVPSAFLRLFGLVSGTWYGISRSILLVLPFLSLRSLPSGA